MERYAWRATIKPGMRAEYIRRHNEIWPDMLEALKSAGIENYSIWVMKDELFGYYECKLGRAHTVEVQRSNPVFAKWSEYMRDVMTMALDPETGERLEMKEIFRLD